MGKNIVGAIQSGRINPHSFRLSLNWRNAKGHFEKPEAGKAEGRFGPSSPLHGILQEVVRGAQLESAAEIIELRPILRYYPESNGVTGDQPHIVNFEELKLLIVEPESLEAKKIWVRACRESLALHALNSNLSEIDPDNVSINNINRQLGKRRLDVRGLVGDVKTAEKNGVLSREEATRLKLIIHAIQKTELWGVNEANQVLEKIGYRLILNKGRVSLIKVKGHNIGKLILLSGPSATGKGSTIDRLKKNQVPLNQFHLTNTRSMRTEVGESQGNPYEFITAEKYEIEDMRKRGETEWTRVIIEALKAVGVEDPKDPAFERVMKAKWPKVEYPEAEKLAELVKMEKFTKLANEGEFLVTSLVREDFQGVGRKLFERVRGGENLFLEADTHLAKKIVDLKEYEGLDSVAVMMTPPSGEELVSRMTNRNTETPERINSRLAAAAGELDASKKHQVHDMEIENDFLVRTSEEFAFTAGLVRRTSKLWKSEDFNGWKVSQAYLDIIKYRYINNRIFPMNPEMIKTDPTKGQIQIVAAEIQRLLEERHPDVVAYANPALVIEAVQNVTSKIPDQEKGMEEYFLALMPSVGDPLHFGHVSTLLASVLDMNLNGAVLSLSGSFADKNELLAYHHRMAIAQRTLEPYSPWVTESSASRYVPNVLGKTRRKLVTKEGHEFSIPIVEENPEAQQCIARIAGIAWLKFMNPKTRWILLSDSSNINESTSGKPENQGREESFRNTLLALSRLDIPMLYFERNNVPIRLPVWMKKYQEEGFLTESQIASYDHIPSTQLWDMIIDYDPIEIDRAVIRQIGSSALNYIQNQKINELYRFLKGVREGAISRDSDAYKDAILRFKAEGLID